jgi:hypothetical protein
MLQAFLPFIVVDEDVIQIHHHKIIGEMPQDIIHYLHESCWDIIQTKEHDQPFKNAFFGIESIFPYICLLYWDLMVIKLKINCTEVFVPLELAREIIDLRNHVLVIDFDFI